MAYFQSLLLVCFSSVLFLQTSLICASADEGRKEYIVYMGSLPRGRQYSPSSHHVSLLQKVVGRSFYPNLIVRSYERSFNGFAANLTNSEAQKLSSMEDVVSVFPVTKYKLLTTRSWDFLGLSENITRIPKAESDVVIGLLDSGIWPESASFGDEGFGPPPKKWKGACKGGSNFTCNKDEEGHGTHTASTAAGNAVKDVSFYGFAEGTARGGVPSARIAAYKVCGADGCASDDILAAFDDAIADGVDIISVSLGPDEAVRQEEDPIAIGSFHANEKGLLTINAAGNSGPKELTTASVAPWLLSVAASSTDRSIIDRVVLGNGSNLIGWSINTFSLNGTEFPLIHGSDAASEGCPKEFAGLCASDCLNRSLVKGKIVLCDRNIGLTEALSSGALGSIYQSDINVSFVAPFPALSLNKIDYLVVTSYYNLTKNGSRHTPVANILKSETIKDPFAPTVASFSSRGPNLFFFEVMKPDVSAPGTEILAAYPPNAPASDYPGEQRHVKYNILSGTSMSCPHVSGIAAYIKSFHPDWSPSAIKSAIMTTAIPMNATANRQTEFAYGSGHVNPINATQPGLVYELFREDYIKLLCLNRMFDTRRIRLITGDNSSCPEDVVKAPMLDFNYPALIAVIDIGAKFTVVLQRTVKNVGQANSTYKVNVEPTSRFTVKVEPEILSFKALEETKSFKVTLSGDEIGYDNPSTSLVWTDGIHNVRTPVIVVPVLFLR